jgi:hypothetical protein
MRKSPNQSTIPGAAKKSVSFPHALFMDAQLRQRALRLPTFSDYIQHLMRQDTALLEASSGGR